jgi:hypothetical protein
VNVAPDLIRLSFCHFCSYKPKSKWHAVDVWEWDAVVAVPEPVVTHVKRLCLQLWAWVGTTAATAAAACFEFLFLKNSHV